MVRTLRNASAPSSLPSDSHENVVQGRFAHFEAPDRSLGKKGAQDLLRIVIPAQPEFLHLPEVIDRFDSVQPLDRGQTCFGPDPNGVLP